MAETRERLIVEQIKSFHKDSTPEGLWTVLGVIDKSGAHTLEEENRVWCEYEGLPNFVAEILNIDRISVYHILSMYYNELKDAEAEARDDYLEFQRERREIQNGE